MNSSLGYVNHFIYKYKKLKIYNAKNIELTVTVLVEGQQHTLKCKIGFIQNIHFSSQNLKKNIFLSETDY